MCKKDAQVCDALTLMNVCEVGDSVQSLGEVKELAERMNGMSRTSK